MPRGRILVGCSGWSYKHWRDGVFYPAGLQPRDWFAHYATHFPCVEINNTFYRLPTEEAVRAWEAQAPDGFVFAVKASRFLTHMKRLLDPETHVPRFLSRILPLGDHLGPILYQTPPQMPPDHARLRAFLQALPRDLDHVFEFRDKAWYTEVTYDLLGEFGVGLCAHDMKGETPRVATARVTYVRFHGGGDTGEYHEERLRPWVPTLEAWARGGHEVHVYFNNDWYGAAPRDAQRLAAMLPARLVENRVA